MIDLASVRLTFGSFQAFDQTYSSWNLWRYVGSNEPGDSTVTRMQKGTVQFKDPVR